jgi:hypothetical protein
MNYLTPCWCKRLDQNKGKKLNLANAQHARDGMPLCNHLCAELYDSQKETRERKQFQFAQDDGA